jgi:outer membrane protein assembly factor BamD (BamD/ComL family)
MKRAMMKGILLSVILALLVGCGKVADEKLMGEANDLAENGDYSKAITNYEILVSLHPNSVLAPEALFRAGLTQILGPEDFYSAMKSFQRILDEYETSHFAEGCKALVASIQAEAESSPPNLLYQTGLAYTNVIQDFDRGIDTFNKVVEKYPETTSAAPSQFMIGFIYANNSLKLEEARTAYNTFLENYPDHELATSVRWELKYLGKDINEIPELQNLDAAVNSEGGNN